MSKEFFMEIAGHTYMLVQDEFGSWLIEGKPYLEWLETDAPPEVIEAAAKKGLEMATSNPAETEDAIQRVEMPTEQADLLRQFYPNPESKDA